MKYVVRNEILNHTGCVVSILICVFHTGAKIRCDYNMCAAAAREFCGWKLSLETRPSSSPAKNILDVIKRKMTDFDTIEVSTDTMTKILTLLFREEDGKLYLLNTTITLSSTPTFMEFKVVKRS